MAQDFGIFRPVQKGGFFPEEQMTQLTFWKPWFEDGGWYFPYLTNNNKGPRLESLTNKGV